jgi:glutamyl-Q tRNA(Asp) synthetase
MGSLVAAMASYLDAKAHRGTWLVRIEDLDFDRNLKGADHDILAALIRCGMQWDEDVVWQSQRTALYEAALEQLGNYVFPCSCSRKEIADSRLRAGLIDQQIYPGTCRNGSQNERPARSFRLRVPDHAWATIYFDDRLMGAQQQDLSTDVGDFVLKRADGFWAYQLAVVVDDAAQGINNVVRGADLLDSTARQIYLQQLLGLPTPHYCHVSVVTNVDGEKLSKQTGALAFDYRSQNILKDALLPAAQFLGLGLTGEVKQVATFWQQAILAWANKMQISN